jgi:transmembrane sensor
MNQRDIFDQLIDNPLFFKWIFHPTPELNAYWALYLENTPDVAEKVKVLKSQIEKYFLYEDIKLNDEDNRALAKRILSKLDEADRNRTRNLIIRSAMRYAAVALLFLLVGGVLAYFYLEDKKTQYFVETPNSDPKLEEPVLILSDRQRFTLNRGESQLEYSPGGEIIVNREQTIKSDNPNSSPEINTLLIPYGSRSMITLADGTRVWLNAGSRLIYPTHFVNKTREVYLSGEAFFDVQENEKQPFEVVTSDVRVNVAGTQFNVTAYPEDFSVQAVLVEGSVEIKSAIAGRRDKGVLIEPGQLAYFNKKTQEVRVQKVNIDEYTLWTRGLLHFSNTDFNRITKKLERYYNIQFQFDDPLKGGIQVSGKLDVAKERSEVLKYLETLTGLHFIQINDRLYVIK